MDPVFDIASFTLPDQTDLRYGIIRSEIPEADQTPVVFVPGLGGSVKNALVFLKQFAKHYGTVYSMDARGFGINDSLPPKANPQHYLRDLRQFVNYLQQQNAITPEKQPIIIGLSLGAIYTTLFVTEFQHPFSHVILMAPSFQPHPKLFSWSYRVKNYAQFFFKWHGAKTTLPYTIKELSRCPERYQNSNFEEPLSLPTFYLFLVDLLCRKAFRKAGRITQPTAMIIPDKDIICNPLMMKKAIDRITHKNKMAFNYPELFHDVCMEPDLDQEQIVNDLLRWLGKGDVTQEKPVESVSLKP